MALARTKLTVGSLVAALAVVALWLAWPRATDASNGAAQPPGSSDPAAGPEGDGAELAQPAPERVPSGTEREQVAVETERGHAGVATGGNRAFAAGRCVDGFGAPLEGVRIVGTDARSERDGRFEVAFALGALETADRALRFERDDVARHDLEVALTAGSTTDVGEVVLLPGAAVSGRVVDVDGAPVPEAWLRVQDAAQVGSSSRLYGPHTYLLADRADGEGRFELVGVPIGTQVVWAGDADHAWASSDAFDVEAGQPVRDVVVTLEARNAEDTITLRVVGPEGEPVAKAQVRYSYRGGGVSGSGTWNADEQGRVELPLDRPATYAFLAAHPEGELRPALVRDVQPGARDVELRLGASRVFTLRVVDAKDRAVEDFEVTLELDAELFFGSGFSFSTVAPEAPRTVRAAAPGELELQVPLTPFRLRVEAEGYRVVTTELLPPESVGAFFPVVLEALPGIAGRVTTAAGEPVRGATVGLYPRVEPNRRVTVNGFPALSRPNPAARGETDADGRFRLTLRETGDYFLRAFAEGFATSELGPLALDPAVGVDDLEVEVGPGGTLEGEVVVPAGQSPTEVVVGLSRADGLGFTLRPDPRGHFRAENLTPGPWQVVRRDEEVSRGRTSTSTSSADIPLELEWDTTVHEGETTYFVLDLRDQQEATLHGRVDLGDVQLLGWRVDLDPLDDLVATGTTSHFGAGGVYHVSSKAAGRMRVTFLGTVGDSTLRLRREIRLDRGDNTLDVELATGALRGVALAGTVDLDKGFGLVSEVQGVEAIASLTPDAEGRFAHDAFPAGPAKLHYATTDGAHASREVTIRAGETTTVDLR